MSRRTTGERGRSHGVGGNLHDVVRHRWTSVVSTRQRSEPLTSVTVDPACWGVSRRRSRGPGLELAGRSIGELAPISETTSASWTTRSIVATASRTACLLQLRRERSRLLEEWRDGGNRARHGGGHAVGSSEATDPPRGRRTPTRPTACGSIATRSISEPALLLRRPGPSANATPPHPRCGRSAQLWTAADSRCRHLSRVATLARSGASYRRSWQRSYLAPRALTS